MLTKGFIIVGAGGHAKVVYDAAVADGEWAAQQISIVQTSEVEGQPVFLKRHPIEQAKNAMFEGASFHVAIGNNAVRTNLAKQYMAAGGKIVSVEHQTSVISPFTRIGAGTFVAANAVVGPDVEIGQLVIVNHSAVIDHDCLVGSGSHIAPGVRLGGAVSIGNECLIGTGAVVLPGIEIGDRVTIGAGSVVTKNIASGATVKGIPAR